MNITTRRRGGALAGALVLAASLLVPTPAFAADAPAVKDEQIRLDTGHIDAFNLVVGADEAVRLLLKEDATGSGVLRTPESVELYVKPQAKTTVREGYIPGLSGEAYVLPLTQDHNLIWPGWDTNEIKPAYGSGSTDIVVSDIDAPEGGQVFIWTQSLFGSASLLKDKGFTLPGTILQSYPAHTHAAWAFTEKGTYKFTVRAVVTSADGTKTASSATQTYTFVVDERSTLTPAAPARDGNTVTIPEQDWVEYRNAANGELLPAGPIELAADLAVEARLSSGYDLAQGAEANWTFEVAAPSVEIDPLSHHYHSGSSIALKATVKQAKAEKFQWFVQRVDQAAPVALPGTGATNTLTAEQALHDARISVTALDAAGVVIAESETRTVEIDDHGAAPLQKVTVSGAADHYHSGDTARLAATVAPASVLDRYQWRVQKRGDAKPVDVPGANSSTYDFTVDKQLDGAKISAVLTYSDGKEYVVSEAVNIEIDDHEPHPAPTLTITGLDESYRVGETAHLIALQTPGTDEDHYHWFIKRAGDTAFTVIPGALTEKLAHVIAKGDDKAQIIAKLYDHDHQVITESAPVTLAVAADTPDPVPSKPTSAPQPQTAASLAGGAVGGISASTTTPVAGTTLTVRVGEGTSHANQWVAAWLFSAPNLLTPDWAQVSAAGTITVTVPVGTTPEAHRLAVYDATGALIGWQTLTVGALPDGGTPSDPDGGQRPVKPVSSETRDIALAATGAELGYSAAFAAGLLLLVGAGVLFAARRRRTAGGSDVTETD